MLVPQILIFQNNASELIFRDITPAYSPNYVGGYGGVNIDADQVTHVVLTLDFGREMVYEIRGAYKQTDGDWTIASYELPVKTPQPGSGCIGCGHAEDFRFDQGVMEEFPSGCLTVSYKVYTGAENARVLQGQAITKFILRIKQEKRLIAAVQKLTIPKADGCFDDKLSPEKRTEMLRYVNISWMNLEMIENQTGCDCDCMAGTLKQIDAYLDMVLK